MQLGVGAMEQARRQQLNEAVILIDMVVLLHDETDLFGVERLSSINI
jgi:hypothetical protein